MEKNIRLLFLVTTTFFIDIKALNNTITSTPIQLPSLAGQLAKLAGPVASGGVVDLKPSDNYLTKSTLDFDVAGISTITEHNLIGNYKDAVILDIPPRRMWGWGGNWSGYCGAMSFQMCGIYFGNLVSEEIVRYAANSNDKQVLIGSGNDLVAADALQYTHDSYAGSTIDDFIKWVKNHIDQGHPVMLGVYQYHKPNENADPDYDHIVPIIGYSFDEKKEVNGFYFHDLYLKNYTLIKGVNYADFKNKCFKTRKETKQLKAYKLPGINGAPITSKSSILPAYAQGKMGQKGYEICAFTYAIPVGTQYALAITGIKNTVETERLFRTKLTVSAWQEPDWGHEDQQNKAPVNFNCEAVVYGLTPGKYYSILRFEPTINIANRTIDSSGIPVSNYQNANYTQNIIFKAQSTVESINVGLLQSNKAYFFRTIEGQF